MSDDTPDKEPVTETQALPKKNRQRVLRHGLKVLGAVWLAGFAFVLAAFVMMIDRDIRAPGWVAERIEARADQVMGGAQVRFGEITVRIGRDLHPTVRLIDTQIFDEAGLTLARIPQIDGLVSPRGLLLRRDVLLQRVNVRGAQVNLRRASDGTLSVAVGGGTLGEDLSLPEMLAQGDALFERPALAALETVNAAGLVINFDDARAGRSWIVDGGDVSLDLRGGVTALRGDMSLLSGGADVTQASLSYSSPRGSPQAELAVNITDVLARDIAAQSPALTWLRDIDAPLTAALRTSLDEQGRLGPLSAVLEIGAGALRPNPSTAPVQFDAAKAYLTYDPVRDQIVFDDVTLESDWGSLRGEGVAYLREFRDGLPRSLLGQFRFADVVVNPAGLYDAPLKVPAAAIDLRLRLEPFTVEIGQLVVNDGPTQMIARGQAQATDAGWELALDAGVDQITPQAVLPYWPVAAKPGTRRWLSENLLGGTLTRTHAGLRVAPGAMPEFALGFEFEDATVKFLRNIPPITAGVGTASLIDNRFVIALDAGEVMAPEGGAVQLAGSVFTIPQVGPPDSPATFDLQAKSTVTAMLSVMNQPPFEYLDKVRLPVTLATGSATTVGGIGFRLKPQMTRADVTFDITADLQDVTSEALVPGRQLSADRLSVVANDAGLTVGGDLQLGAVPATAQWDKRFGQEFAGRSQVVAETEISPAFLDEFRIALPRGMVTGTAQADLTVDLVAGSPPAFALQSDLRGTRLALPALGWAKSANTVGDLQVSGRLGERPAVDRIAIDVGGLRAQGAVELTAAGQLEAARFSRFQVGDWLDAGVTVRGQGAGQPVAIEVSGGQLDLRGLELEPRANGGPAGGSGAPLRVALDRLQISEGVAIAPFSGDFSTRGSFSGRFTGRVNGGTAVTGVVVPQDGRFGLRLRSADAGGLARSAGLMQNGSGGALDLELTPANEPGHFDGVLTVRDGMRVRDAPTIAALLDAISVVGLLQQLDGQGLSFEEVDAQFRLTPQQLIVTQGSAIGPGLGISVDGIYTMPSKQIDMQGVVSPIYLVNSLGAFLTRKGEGLIGFNFNIAGTTGAPQVSVNPLSVLTPGMFRDLFRRPPPVVSQ